MELTSYYSETTAVMLKNIFSEIAFNLSIFMSPCYKWLVYICLFVALRSWSSGWCNNYLCYYIVVFSLSAYHEQGHQ